MAKLQDDQDPSSLILQERVNSLRKKKGWTLDELSNACGVSKSMLSQLERGQANPTLGLAYRIAQAFGVSLSDLVEPEPNQSTIDVVKHGQPSYVFRDDEKCQIRTLSPLHLEKDIEFYEITLQVGGEIDSPAHFKGTREFLAIHDGEVEISAGTDNKQLAKGDSACYPADVDHKITNTGKSVVSAYLVVTYSGEN